jgi:hypothetical protein
MFDPLDKVVLFGGRSRGSTAPGTSRRSSLPPAPRPGFRVGDLAPASRWPPSPGPEWAARGCGRRLGDAGNDEGRLGGTPGGLRTAPRWETTRGPLGASLVVLAPIGRTERTEGEGEHATPRLRIEGLAAAEGIRDRQGCRTSQERTRPRPVGREAEIGLARARLPFRLAVPKDEVHGVRYRAAARPPGSWVAVGRRSGRERHSTCSPRLGAAQDFKSTK